MENTYRFSFPIVDNWDSVPKTRDDACNRLKSIINKREAISFSSSVIGELIENVIKYADWSKPMTPSLEITVSQDKTIVKIKTSNAIPHGSRHAQEVNKLIEFINSFESSTEASAAHFIMNAEASSGEDNNEDGSRIQQGGLLRIATMIEDKDGKSQIEADLDSNSVLHITATMNL